MHERGLVMEQEERYGPELDQFLPVGFLKVQATMGQQTLPVPGAHVVVSRLQNNGTRRIFFEGDTDGDGILDGIALPTQLKSFSEFPQSAVEPNFNYDVLVTKPGFRQVLIERIPIFAGVKSIQPVNMIPLAGTVEE